LCKTSLAYLGDFASREPVPIYQTLAGAPWTKSPVTSMQEVLQEVYAGFQWVMTW
jgi:hypothetical protein